MKVCCLIKDCSTKVLYDLIQYGYIIEAAILYYPIRNGWKLWYGINGLFYYKPYRIDNPMTYGILD